ncbi:hypothetical protein [Paenibacillus alba]|uniref:Glycosyltransferase RgtA/B/C/D-like domain-containing protein n=1 Tax=Paenibacillus alba TaxID=1197127 RepID=A0ABU6FXQ1_9BACL|nr:hypothetical protein [Paenibacillus alba]MEC0226700.1 hypothetical protein [Paenibacillus alba]
MPKISSKILIFKWELLSIMICSLGFTIWNVSAVQEFYFQVPLFFTGICILFWLTGRLFLLKCPISFKKFADFNLYFLIGFFVINTALLFMLYLLPFNIKTDLFILCMGVILLTLFHTNSNHIVKPSTPSEIKKSSFIALLIIMVAVTFWMQSSTQAVQPSGKIIIFKPWLDSFFHTSVVRSITNSQGFSSIQHLLLANQPMPFYHFAMYLFPAELCSFTPTSAYQAFNSFLTPMGCVLSGLGAYVLISSFWGHRAGIAAVVGILLIPDAAESGFHNAWLSYHWLQQIAPGGFYGVALMALTWMIMVHGCREGRFSFVVTSYFLTLLCIAYKFHIFFANALVIWIFPALFFSKVSIKIRMIWSTFSIISYFLVINYTQQIKEAPFIRYDGSASESYSQYTIAQFENIWLKELFTTSITPGHSLLNSVYWYSIMALMLFIGTLGILGLLYFLLIGKLRSTTVLSILLLPLLVICNYLITSLTIAYDSHQIGNPEELMHRPLVWAYFIVSIWVSGAISHWSQTYLNISKIPRYTFAVMVLLFLLVPLILGKDVQNGPLWGKDFTNTAYSAGLVGALQYTREHSIKGNIIQDSHFDPKLIVSALSEQQIFVSLYKNLDLPIQSNRVEELINVKKMTNSENIISYFINNKIRWFLAYPDDQMDWPIEMDRQLVYEQDGYKVYSFHE